jgi:hypothetical protein
MSYRARTDIFLQYRRSYRSVAGVREDVLKKDRFSGQKGDYTVLNVEEVDDNWLAWMSSLGRLRRYIHEIEERGRAK